MKTRLRSNEVSVAQVIEKITIKNKLGIHARPAALLVQRASKFKSIIELENEDVKVNGKSIMGVMMLAAAYGSELTIFADGDDAHEAVQAIHDIINSKFDEE